MEQDKMGIITRFIKAKAAPLDKIISGIIRTEFTILGVQSYIECPDGELISFNNILEDNDDCQVYIVILSKKEK